MKAAQLAKQRSELAEALAAAEEEWLTLSSEVEAQADEELQDGVIVLKRTPSPDAAF